MWKIFLVALLGFLSMGSVVVWGQYPQKPTTWVDNNEWFDGKNGIAPPTYTLNLATQTWSPNAPTTCPSITFHLPYWTVGSPTFSGLQQVETDVEACRTASGGTTGFLITVPHALYTTPGANGFAIGQTSSTPASSYIVYISASDSSLSQSTTVCSHGTQKNLPESTIPGLNNPDCAGDAMYYRNGVKTSAITAASCPGTTCTVTSTVNPGVGNSATLLNVTPVGYDGTWTVTSSSSSQFQFILSPTTNPVTAFSESGTTVTATSNLAPDLNSLVTVVATGTTPTGYNCTACTVTATTSSTFKYTVGPSGLGAGTTGTAVVVGEPAASAFGAVSAGNITNIPAGAFTLANGTPTNTSAYNDAANLWTLENSNATPVGVLTFCTASSVGTTPSCTTNIGPDHRVFIDLEVRPQAGVKNQATNPINIAGGQTSLTQMAASIHFLRNWVHGDWTSLTAGTNQISDGINLNGCAHCSVMYSQISQIMRPGAESHAINDDGYQTKINDNWIEGSSTSIFTGGYSSLAGPSIAGYVPYYDIEVRRNVMTYPYQWLGQSPVTTNPNFTPSFSTVRKNCLENKEGYRVLYSGNICENVDSSGGQNNAILWQDLNRSAGGLGENYQTTAHDFTFEYNIVSDSCAGLALERSDTANGGVGYAIHHFWFNNNLFYQISAGSGTTSPGCSTSGKTGHSFSAAGQQWQGTQTCNGTSCTFVANCNIGGTNGTGTGTGGCIGQIYSLTITNPGTCSANGNLTFTAPQITEGLLPEGTYTCSAGVLATVSLTTTAFYLQAGSGYTAAPTIGFSGTCTSCAVTATLVTSGTAQTQPAVGYEDFDINAGDPVAITMCSNSAYNNVSDKSWPGPQHWPSAIAPMASTGSTAWSGSYNVAGVTVTYPSSETGSETSGYCTLTNTQGDPQNLIYTHNLLVTDATWDLTAGNEPLSQGGPNFQINAEFQNNIWTGGGWFNNPLGEGNPTVIWDYDITSLTADHDLWTGRTSTLYTPFYGANSSFPVGSPALLFPSTGYCSGSTATAYTGVGTGCLGFTGVMSASSMPLTLADYHNWALVASSSFKSGGTYQASDGTDMGPNISAIDAAQTNNCYAPCGLNGPYPDSLDNPTAFMGGILQ